MSKWAEWSYTGGVISIDDGPKDHVLVGASCAIWKYGARIGKMPLKKVVWRIKGTKTVAKLKDFKVLNLNTVNMCHPECKHWCYRQIKNAAMAKDLWCCEHCQLREAQLLKF